MIAENTIHKRRLVELVFFCGFNDIIENKK